MDLHIFTIHGAPRRFNSDVELYYLFFLTGSKESIHSTALRLLGGFLRHLPGLGIL